uniref:F-box domain-containing protein n=1 Tax=Schistosoma mansoni TaxID=6183 RepID=A0A5K4FC47_SCHMA
MPDLPFCISHCSGCLILTCDAVECFVTDCPNGCGMRMHSCKVDDHVGQICPKTIVPCINKELGCPHLICREDKSFHLLSCPASVVSCNARCPLLFRQTEKKSTSPVTCTVNPIIHYASCNSYVYRPINSPLLGVDFDANQRTFTNQTDGHISNVLKLINEEQVDKTLSSGFVESPLSSYMCGHPGYICGCAVQRTNYGSHYQLHSNVQAQLDGWIELRCPLSFLGCKYAVVNLRPNSEYNHLLYNPTLATFTTRYESETNQHNILTPYSKLTNSECFNFDQLPAELLIYLSFFLDDMSLLCLSKVSNRLSTVYKNILCARLIVTPQWDKVHHRSSDLFSWRITGFLWSFPQRAESIKGWRSAHGASARSKISAHLTSCHYNDKTIRVFPFCYLE